MASYPNKDPSVWNRCGAVTVKDWKTMTSSWELYITSWELYLTSFHSTLPSPIYISHEGKLSQQITGELCTVPGKTWGTSTFAGCETSPLCCDSSSGFMLLNKQADIISNFILIWDFSQSQCSVRNQGSCL